MLRLRRYEWTDVLGDGNVKCEDASDTVDWLWIVICTAGAAKLDIVNDGPFTICLSEDGTTVDDDEVLVEYKDRVMLLLRYSEAFCAEPAVSIAMPECQTAHSNNGESLPTSPIATGHSERKLWNDG